MIEPEMKQTDACDFWVLSPQEGQVVRPLVHVGTAHDYFRAQRDLLALINGTFFNHLSDTPYVLGDVKTEWDLAWGFHTKPFNRQREAGRQDDRIYYWQPAADSENPGLANRWSLAVGKEGARLLQGQRRLYSEYADDRWVLGGGALLLREGEVPFEDSGDLAEETKGGFSTAQTYRTRHALLLVTGEGEVELGVNRDEVDVMTLAESLRELDYRDALMLDGGGATTLIYKDRDGRLETVYYHTHYPALHNCVGILN